MWSSAVYEEKEEEEEMRLVDNALINGWCCCFPSLPFSIVCFIRFVFSFLTISFLILICSGGNKLYDPPSFSLSLFLSFTYSIFFPSKDNDGDSTGNPK